MNSSVEYYSVSHKGYTKYPNVEIIGVENYSFHPGNPLPQRQLQDKSIIKEEELEYQAPEAKSSKEIPSIRQPYKVRQILEKEQVNSVHLTTPKCNNQVPNLTHSLSSNNHVQPKGILKRSLQELHNKNITSQQDLACDKHLYLQLEKQRKLRKDLEKTYKNLLSEMQRKERAYSADLSQEREEGRKQQFSKRTLNYQKQNQAEYDDLQPPSSRNKASQATIKRPQVIKDRQGHDGKEEDLESRSDNSEEIRKHLMTQQSAQSEDYFRGQRQFQQRVLSQLRNLSKRIGQIDQYLLDREREEEKERLNAIIQQKEREIKRVELENSQLRQQEEGEVSIESLKKLSPTSLYFFLIILMALVAMS